MLMIGDFFEWVCYASCINCRLSFLASKDIVQGFY